MKNIVVAIVRLKFSEPAVKYALGFAKSHDKNDT